jgi:hypothetical protein
MGHRGWSLLREREDEFQNLHNDLHSRHDASRGHYRPYEGSVAFHESFQADGQ